MEEEDIIDPEALPPKLFQCSVCPSAFTRNTGRTRHYREIHKNIGANGEQLTKPIVNIPRKLYYSCLMCAKSFRQKGGRDQHLKKIHNRDENAKKETEQNLVPNYECDICGEEFMDETIFLNHKSLHPTYLPRISRHDSVYECEICEREFSTNRSRARHYWLVHNGSKISEQAEGMSHTEITKSKSPPPPTLEDSENEPPPTVDDSEDETKNKFSCYICSNSFATNFSRSRHIRSVHNGVVVLNEGPRVYKKGRAGRNGKIKSDPFTIFYPCDICGCVFSRNFAREQHYQNIHNGKRHYIEVHSGVEDGSAGNATQSKSVVVRSRQTNYPCIICKKIYFTTNKKRELHYKNVHNGAKLVSTIDKSDKYILEGHKIIYPCTICNVVFARKQHLDRHSREGHHGNRSLRIEKGCSGIRPADVVTIDNGFQCDACGEVFDSHLFLVRHKSTKPQDNNGELQAHAAGPSSLLALQVITDDSQSFVVTYVNDDENGGGHIEAVNDANGGHIGAANDANGGHIGAVNEQLAAAGLAVKNEFVERVVIDDDEPGESFFVKCEPEESFSIEDEPVENFASLHEPEESFIVPDEPIESFTIEDLPIKSLSVAVEPEESTPESKRKPNRKRSSVERQTSAKSSKSGVFSCDICHGIFTQNSSLKRHWKAVHNKDSETFPCGICENSAFSTNSGRLRHYRTVHNSAFIGGSNAEEEEALSLKLKQLKTKQPGTTFHCAICKASFTRKGTRERHYRIMHDGARTLDENVKLNVTCDICHDIFTTHTSLKRHWKAVHNKDSETFPCGICENSAFSTNSGRLRHYRTFHNSAFIGGEEEEALSLKLKQLKPKQLGITFLCAICKASFTRKRTRDRHYRVIHDGARTLDENVKGMVLSVAKQNVTCDICHDIFTTHASLNRHWEAIHNKDSKTFPCGICESSVFSTNYSLLRHYRTFHKSTSNEGSNAEGEEALPLKLKPLKTKRPVTSFLCAICKTSFTRKGTRERHYRIMHDGARTLDENVKNVVLSVANMRHICDICGDDFDSKLMLDSHKSSEHATNKDIPNTAFSGTAKLNDQLNSEVAVKEENNTDLLLHIVKEEYEVYENSFTQEIVSDNVKNGEDSNDEPANNAYLDTTAKWQYI